MHNSEEVDGASKTMKQLFQNEECFPHLGKEEMSAAIWFWQLV
jgi:hypothetical protein